MNTNNTQGLFPIDVVTMQMLGISTSRNIHPESAEYAMSMYELTQSLEASESLSRLKETGIIAESKDGQIYFTKKGKKKYAKHTTTPSTYLKLNGFKDFSHQDIVYFLPQIIKEVVSRQKSDDFMRELGNDILNNIDKFNLVTGDFAEVCQEAVLLANAESQIEIV